MCIRDRCYDCCAEVDRQWMRENGRISLYLSRDDGGHWYVSNWPGSLKFDPLRQSTGRHNIGGHRHDVWFRFEGEVWHGVQIGEWNQVCHCRRTKYAA